MLIAIAATVKAQSISDNELMSVSAGVSTFSFDKSLSGNNDILSFQKNDLNKLTEQEQYNKASFSSLAKDKVSELDGNEIEGPEGIENEGPGGSDHQFEGEETGDH